MSKERLEEIKFKFYKTGYVINRASADVSQIKRDLEYLIEQAERVEALEKWVENERNIAGKAQNRVVRVEKQNKRYREALEYMLNGKSSDYSTTENMLDDYLFIARKTLEGESK